MKKIFIYILLLACCLDMTMCAPEFTMNDVVFMVEAQTNNVEYGHVTGGGRFHYKEEITLQAVPTTNYEFIAWSDGVKDNPRKIIVSCDMSLTATFEIPKENGHEYVDLGLPSGTLWATCNVGAYAPEEYGGYFAWGETSPKSTYNWSTYKHCNGSYTTLTKYCTDTRYGVADGKTILEPADDAATVNWGGRWRMPTVEELQELVDKCDWYCRKSGCYIYGPNGNYIFLPIVGFYEDASLKSAGGYGCYSSSSIDDSNPSSMYFLQCESNGYEVRTASRHYGFSVRPVTGKTSTSSTYTIAVATNDTAMGFVSGAGTYTAGETATLIATPAKDCQFINWSDGNTENPRKIVVTQDMNLIANFALSQYTINVSANDETMGNVSGGGTYTKGTSVRLSATPNEGYHFVKWSDENTDNPRMIVVTQDMNLIANFALLQYTINLGVNNETMGCVTGGGTYTPGTAVTLYATPNEGYRFVRWSDDNTDNPRTIIVSKDMDLTAYFGLPAVNGHEYIDLNLPSGTLWATCNVGATNPEDYGDYFAWGETESKENYNEDYYKWGVTNWDDAPNYGMTKYNKTDGKTVLDPEDDAATVNWGGDWRMPTEAERDELSTECTWSWTTLNGVNGYRVTGKNGNFIFLPAAGAREDLEILSAGSGGFYWLSSLSGVCRWAYCHRFGESYYNDSGEVARWLGFTVRPVCSPQ